MAIAKSTMLLYAITDRTWLGERTLTEQVQDALEGGVSLLQYREKHLEGEAKIAQAKEILALCRKYDVPLIINDDPLLAKEIGADGVHVGQKDMAPEKVRQIIGPEMVLGVSARTVEQALAAQAAGADYLGSGAVFHTGTKGDARALSHEVLREICGSVEIPVVAIGGIDENNIVQLENTGIAGVAVVSAIFSKEDVTKAARTLAEIVNSRIVRPRE